METRDAESTPAGATSRLDNFVVAMPFMIQNKEDSNCKADMFVGNLNETKISSVGYDDKELLFARRISNP